ncbi:MAG TPA: protein kinase, partial [Catenuloplanes sp.]
MTGGGPVDSPVDIPGLTIGPEIGRGACSVVYRCTREGRGYAVKVALGALAHDPPTLRAFRREATLLACLRHPNLVAVHEAGETDGRPYLVMDLAEGGTLDTLLTQGRVPVRSAGRIGLDIAAALSEAHSRGLVHRDVKPQNIVVGPTGAATLIDFGLSARTGVHAETAVVGTVHYSAPEQTGMRDRPVDARSDLYCLGVVLYECLAGVNPFAGATVAEVMRLHADVEPAPLRQLRPDVPEAVERVVARLLAKDPDERYQSATELGHDLARATGLDAVRAGAPGSAADSGTGARAHELGQLVRAWSECRVGQRGVATVHGAAGSGKSHLVTRLLASVSRDVGVALRAKCAPADITPLAVLCDALTEHLRALTLLDPSERLAAEDRVRSAAGPDAELLARLHPDLAAVLRTGPLPAGVAVPEVRFRAAIVRFLSELARLAGGLVLWVDDVQWLGHADRRVLKDLAGDPDEAPVLLVGTSREQELNLPPGAGLHTDIGLAPLDPDDVRDLLISYLGGVTDDGFIRDVTARSAGSPLAVVEYLRAVIDAGLIRPSWGRYLLDRDALDSLDLPAEVIALILRRVEALSARAEPVLVAAAILGSPFDPTVLPRLARTTAAQVQAAVAEAQAKQLVAPAGRGRWRFVHDRVQEALLSTLPQAQRRDAHRRAADVLDAVGAGHDERIYRLAHHSILGGLPAARRFAITAAAARRALTALASTEAQTLFRAAAAAAAAAGIEPGSDFEESFGIACTRTARPQDALVHFWRAVDLADGPRERARILAAIADVEFGERRYDAAAEHTARGLAAAGHALPANPVALLLTTVVRMVVGGLCRWSWTGFGAATGAERELCQIRARLHIVAARAAFMRREMGRAVAHNLWALRPVHRLGRDVEYITLHTALAPLWAQFGQTRLAHRKLAQVAALATASGNPTLVAEVEMYSGVALELTGEVREAGVRLQNAIVRGACWMDVSQYQIGVGLLVDNLLRRGYWQEAWAVLNPPPGSPGAGWELPHLELVRARIGRSLGYDTRGHIDIEEGTEPARRSYIYRDLVELAVEAGELGADLEAAIAGGDGESVNPALAPLFLRPYWLAKANGRLEQARAAPPGRRYERLQLASAAMKQARAAASVPLLRADLQVLRATEHELNGRFRRALRCLATAQTLILDRDAPRVRFDILVQRARCLRGMGQLEDGRREALLAMALANRSGWLARERWVRQEFTLDRTGMGSAPGGSGGGAPGRARDSRRLDALLRVSSAAAGELDPARVATIALDEVIDILGADRALLLLAGDEPAAGTGATRLELYAGRDADGRNIQELSDYASTLVERARGTGEAVVVTGATEGAALGSLSAVQYDLRSILVAPLPAETGRDGVVYLDSRVARGMFSEDDVELLAAVARQVAVSLRGARSARLQALVLAERRERGLAEALREVTAAAETGQRPSDVLDQALISIRKVVPFDAAWALAGQLTGDVAIISAGGAVAAEVLGTVVPARRFPELLPAFAGRVTEGRGTLDLPGGRGPVASWLAVPLVIRGETVGVLVLTTGSADGYGERQRAIAATLADQAAVTYENVRLFRQVERFARADTPTGAGDHRRLLAAAQDRISEQRAGGR